MNMHVTAAVGAAAALAPSQPHSLLWMCRRARRLYALERKAEQRLFDAEDAGMPTDALDAAHGRVVAALRAAIEDIADVEARTGLEMAHKAALLKPWVRCGCDLHDGGAGYELALSIANDARMFGTGGPIRRQLT